MQDIHTLTLEELCSLTNTSKRTVRYYIQIGLVDRPEGEKRGAKYSAGHVEQLLAIKKWKDAGLSLERIRELLAPGSGPDHVPPLRPRQPGEVSVHSRIYLAPGVELTIDPETSGLDPEQVRDLAHRVVQLFQDISPREAT
ncbi:MAG: MerR family transcriptional regulator [Desulfovibrio sp.]|nr:MAG: MerR family transcriptional regulator [Desulfovibrio sp.]